MLPAVRGAGVGVEPLFAAPGKGAPGPQRRDVLLAGDEVQRRDPELAAVPDDVVRTGLAGHVPAVHLRALLGVYDKTGIEELARGLAEARLAALRTQLQPHFLFNVLNAVTTLVHADPMAADRMLTRFAALLRVILHEGTEEHALERELDLLARYVELMQLRFGDRIVVEWAVADAARGARVPFLVLQPLVENAYEHGLAGRETGGRVRIGAARAGDRLQLVVEDDGSGLDVDAGPIIGRGNAGTGNGIGLRNTRDRLAQLYGARASLVLERPPGGGTRALVTLPFIDGPHRNGEPRP